MRDTMLLFFLLVGMYATAQIPHQKTGSSIPLKDAQEILDHHNSIRKKTGVPPLLWSANLSAYAQAWSDHLARSGNCRIKHRAYSGEDGFRYGENIFWASSAAAFRPVDASISWYQESRMYRYGKLTGRNFYNTGHYTQMIWRDTKLMGVGIARCANGSLIVVANYFPCGNVIGQFPY